MKKTYARYFAIVKLAKRFCSRVNTKGWVA